MSTWTVQQGVWKVQSLPKCDWLNRNQKVSCTKFLSLAYRLYIWIQFYILFYHSNNFMLDSLSLQPYCLIVMLFCPIVSSSVIHKLLWIHLWMTDSPELNAEHLFSALRVFLAHSCLYLHTTQSMIIQQCHRIHNKVYKCQRSKRKTAWLSFSFCS